MKDKLLVETLIGTFTIEKSSIRILLVKKKTEPYKGYWVLPSEILKENQTLEDNISDLVYEKLGFKKIYIEQNFTFSNITRKGDTRTLGVSYLGLVDMIAATYKADEKEEIEMNWFDIDSLPKMAFDHNIIVETLLKSFKLKVLNSNILKLLFPADFTLPELQCVYEYALDKKLDRRNFRKKLINLNIIEDTGLTNEGYTGRPAKLYRLSTQLEDKNLF